MKRGKLFVSTLIWIVLLGFIIYQVVFRWIPLWKGSTELKGIDVSSLWIEDERGLRVPLSSFKGDILIINFWATWCVPCRLEIPMLNAIYSRLIDKNKQLIGVNQNESLATISAFRKDTQIEFPVYRDVGDLSRRLNIQVIPAIAVVDANGKVQSVTYGFKPWVQAYLLWWI